MGKKQVTYVYVDLETEPVEESVKDIDMILEGTQQAVKGLVTEIRELVDKTDLTPLATQTVNLTRYITKCDGQLLYLRLNMGRLGQSIADAAAPLGAILLPAVNRAVRDLANWLTRWGW